MEREELIKILKEESKTTFPEGCNALAGLNLIKRYCPKKGVQGAEHDIIYSVDIDELLYAGITKEDAIQLRTWNWMYDEDTDGLACFV